MVVVNTTKKLLDEYEFYVSFFIIYACFSLLYPFEVLLSGKQYHSLIIYITSITIDVTVVNQ